MLNRLVQLTAIFCCVYESEPRDVLPHKELYLPNYSVYHDISGLYAKLSQMSQTNEKLSLSWQYKVSDNLLQPLMRFNHSSTDEPLRERIKVLISTGEHAREFFPVEYLLFLLDKFSQNTSPSDVLSQVDIFFLPMLNPSGRRYIEETGEYTVQWK